MDMEWFKNKYTKIIFWSISCIILLFIFVIPCYSGITWLNKLSFGKYYEYTGQIAYHSDENHSPKMFEFCQDHTLFLVTDTFNSEINELKHEHEDIIDLIQYLMSMYHEEVDCDGYGCGYSLTYDGTVPTTLTLRSRLDTIQYTTTPVPELFQVVIRDTVFYTSHIKCGMPIKKVLSDFKLMELYYYNSSIKSIVIIPIDVELDKNSSSINCIYIPSRLLILGIDQGIIRKVELRYPEFRGSHFLESSPFY